MLTPPKDIPFPKGGQKAASSFPLLIRARGRRVLGKSHSPGFSIPRVGESGELLRAGTPLGRVSSPHGRGPTPHQRHPRRRSTMLLAPELWGAAIRRSPRRRTLPAKASSGAQRSPGPRLPPPPMRRDNSSRPAGERLSSPLDRRVAHWPSQGQRDLLGILSRARRAR